MTWCQGQAFVKIHVPGALRPSRVTAWISLSLTWNMRHCRSQASVAGVQSMSSGRRLRFYESRENDHQELLSGESLRLCRKSRARNPPGYEPAPALLQKRSMHRATGYRLRNRVAAAQSNHAVIAGKRAQEKRRCQDLPKDSERM